MEIWWLFLIAAVILLAFFGRRIKLVNLRKEGEAMRSFYEYFRSIYLGMKKNFEKWEEELARHDREMELASKRPLSEPCPECGGQFSIIRFLPLAGCPSFDTLIPTPFYLAIPPTITVCADCGRPI